MRVCTYSWPHVQCGCCPQHSLLLGLCWCRRGRAAVVQLTAYSLLTQAHSVCHSLFVAKMAAVPLFSCNYGRSRVRCSVLLTPSCPVSSRAGWHVM
jgi:hypothetical protein